VRDRGFQLVRDQVDTAPRDARDESVPVPFLAHPLDPMSTSARIGILTISDRASRGEYEDRGGPAIRAYLDEVLASPWEPVARIVPDERAAIEAALVELCDVEGCCLVVTTGGTGPAARDVTPEATEAVVEKLMPGFGELMRQVSLRAVPTAILSRQTAGIRGSSLIVNLPGQPRAIGECLDAVFPAIPYCIDLIGGPFLETNAERLVAFRPKKS
jgi:molybdopterin adenylyltransferase